MGVRALKGKVVLITAATDGLGRGLAATLAREGAILLLHGRDDERGQATLEALTPGCRAGVEVAARPSTISVSSEPGGQAGRDDCKPVGG